MQSSDIIKAIQRVIPKPAVLHEPSFSEIEQKYLLDCLQSGVVSSIGKYVDQFEIQLAEKIGVKKVVVTVNGTAALHTCLILAGVLPGDEVLIPAMTFVATANAVTYCQAIPHLVEHSIDTLGMCPTQLSKYLEKIVVIKSDGFAWNKITGRRISVCVPMHTFGHPVEMDELIHCCERFNIRIVEDAAESLGSSYKKKQTGSFGLLAALSFNGNKIITTGGGGAIATNDEALAKKAKHITTTAKVPHPYQYFHDEVGYNYRMPNINAALGCGQLEKLNEFILQKRALAELYHAEFSNLSGVTIFREPQNCKSNYWLNLLLLDKNHSYLRNDILNETNRLGILTRPAWELMHTLPMYKTCPRMDLSVATHLADSIVSLPSSVKLLKN